MGVTVIIDGNGDPWWIAMEVYAVLGIINHRNAVSALDDDEKNTVRIMDGIPGNPNRQIISEAGLYRLIMRSNKPVAKLFQRWVIHKVLPAIRKTGEYVSPAPAKTKTKTKTKTISPMQQC